MPAYILTSPDGRYYWAGPGMRRLGPQIGPGRLPCWTDRQAAQMAAEGIRAALGVETVVCRVDGRRNT